MSTSRFSYHTDDDPGEGGVTSVGPMGRRGTSHTNNGIPGPAELLLDVSELARTLGMRYTHHFAIPADAIADLGAVTAVTGDVTLTNTGAALLLTGSVSATLSMECVRCLKPTQESVEAELEESFDLVAHHTAYSQDEVKAVDENIEASVIDGSILNLGDLLRQNLLLAAPLQPFCEGGCSNGISVPEEELLSTVPHTPLAALGALWEKRSD